MNEGLILKILSDLSICDIACGVELAAGVLDTLPSGIFCRQIEQDRTDRNLRLGDFTTYSSIRDSSLEHRAGIKSNCNDPAAPSRRPAACRLL